MLLPGTAVAGLHGSSPVFWPTDSRLSFQELQARVLCCTSWLEDPGLEEDVNGLGICFRAEGA